jgi:hypothetical protein
MTSGNLNFLEPSVPLQACNGAAFLHAERLEHQALSKELMQIFIMSVGSVSLSLIQNGVCVCVCVCARRWDGDRRNNFAILW